MNKTQSLYAFHYRNKNTPSSLSFSTLPQIKHLKKLHEKNLQKEKTAQKTNQAILQQFEQRKKHYYNQHERNVELRLSQKWEETQFQRTSIQKQKSEHIRTVIDNHTRIERKNELKRKRMYELEKKKFNKVIQNKHEQQAKSSPKNTSNWDPRKFKTRKENEQISRSDALRDSMGEKLALAQERRQILIERQNQLLKSTLTRKIHKSQMIHSQILDDHLNSNIKSSVRKKIGFDRRMLELDQEKQNWIKRKKQGEQNLKQKARDIRKKQRQIFEKQLVDTVVNENKRMEKSSIFREAKWLSSVQKLKKFRALKNDRVQKKNEELYQKWKEAHLSMYEKDQSRWRRLMKIDSYQKELIEKSIHESTLLSLNK